MSEEPLLPRRVPKLTHFSLEAPAPIERQSLTLNQYPVYIDLMCDYLYLHMQLDALASRKFALKNKLRSEECSSEVKEGLKKTYQLLSDDAKQANDRLVNIRSSLREDYPKANLSTPIEIEVPLSCSEAQLRKDFQREPFVVCGIRFGPSSSSDWGYEFIKLCTHRAISKEMGLTGPLLDELLQKTMCAASRTDIGGQAYVQLLEFDNAQAAVSGEDISDAAIISKGNTPPTCIDVDHEKVTVTVVSHLYKTDPNVLSVYNPDKMAEMEAKRATESSANTSSLFGERNRADAVADHGVTSSSDLSCCDHLLKEPKPDWLTHFQKFMPVMTRTVLRVVSCEKCEKADEKTVCDCERTIKIATVLIFSTVSNIKTGTPVFKTVIEEKVDGTRSNGLWSSIFEFSFGSNTV